MRHRATLRFWSAYQDLPEEIQRLADRCYHLLKEDSGHPSLHFKQVGGYRSVRIGLHHRALAVEEGSDIVWFWIGRHSEYDKLLSLA